MNPFKLLIPGSQGLNYFKNKKKGEAERLKKMQDNVATDTAARMERAKAGGPANFEQGLVRGADIAKKDLGPEALRKAEQSRSTEVVDFLARQNQQSLGLNAGENRALVDKAVAETQGATQGAVRAMRGSMAANGVRGGAAVAAEAGQRMQGAAAMGAANREIMINDIALKRQGLQNYGAAMTGQRAAEYEQVKDKLKTKIGIADMGQQNANLNEQLTAQGKAAIAAQEAQGGGSPFLCTRFRALGLMTPKETRDMTIVFLRGILHQPAAFLYYFKVGHQFLKVADAHNVDWVALKKTFVDDILALPAGSTRSAVYLQEFRVLCRHVGFKEPPTKGSWLGGLLGLARYGRFWKGLWVAARGYLVVRN